MPAEPEKPAFALQTAPCKGPKGASAERGRIASAQTPRKSSTPFRAAEKTCFLKASLSHLCNTESADARKFACGQVRLVHARAPNRKLRAQGAARQCGGTPK